MIIELFKIITKIPRCSGIHKPFIEFIKNYTDKYNYECEIDSYHNILCYKKNGKRNIVLQAHYDIVCLEDGKVPILIEKDGIFTAKDSTLGADNGVGCAYMLALMNENIDAEYLFTSDEEIGLIGANNFSLDLKAKYMLNLDSEEEGEICIGCAGGIDVYTRTERSSIVENTTGKSLYEISLNTKMGGHSGVDIHKEIPNAIKLVINCIKNADGDLLDINGGERINSIPKKAHAIIASSTIPYSTHENMKIKQLDTKTEHYKKIDSSIVSILDSFDDGVREYDSKHNVVKSSINLATIETTINGVEISLSARSMDKESLEDLTNNTIKLFKKNNFYIDSAGKYPPWKPSVNNFTRNIEKIYKTHNTNVKTYAIHAGLECAIFKEKYPVLEIASIGPTIRNPHSTREECEVDSIIRVYKITKDIVNQFKG